MGHMGEMKNVYKILLGNTWSRDRLRIARCRSEIGILRSRKRGLVAAATGGLAVVKTVMNLHAV